MNVLIFMIAVDPARVLIPVVVPGRVSALAHRLPASPPEPSLQPQEVQEQRPAGQRSLPLSHCSQHQPCHWLDSLVFSFLLVCQGSHNLHFNKMVNRKKNYMID